MSTRALGSSAIIAGLTWGILFIAFVPYGVALWTGGDALALAGILGSLVAAIAFSTAAIGLAWRFQDRVSPLGAVGALLVTLGALTSMVGSITMMLIGSVMLMLDLARSGVVPWLLSMGHVAAAIVAGVGLVVGQPNGVDAPTRAVFVALLIPYVLTWIALGVSLVRSTPQVAQASA